MRTKSNVLLLIVLAVIVGFSACKKDEEDPPNNTEQPILVAGEFEMTDGTCTPFCLASISGGIFTLQGIDYSGSTEIVYTETYQRRADNINVYDMTDNSGSYVTVMSAARFTFTSTSRTCEFSQ